MTDIPAKEVYPPQLLAQKLNNRAARCIQIGQYDIAVSSLVRALKLSDEFGEENDNDQLVATCPCPHCSLSHCMTHSQGVARQFASSESIMSSHHDLDKSNLPSSTVKSGYLYRAPICVSPETLEEGHSMGLVLPLILTFNLALAHHLSALNDSSDDDDDKKNGTLVRSKLQRVLRLYELAYRWQMEEENVQINSLLFSLAISNNLGEIHRAVSNDDKHQKYLQHSLSTIIFMVEYHQIEGTAMDMDGFLRNTAGLMLHSRCAGAA